MSFVRVRGAEDLWAGERFAARVRGKRVLLVHAGGGVRAYEDRCPHLNVPLSEGRFEDGRLSCPLHEWTFDAATGCGVNPRAACLRSLPLRIEEGHVLVDVGELLAAGDEEDER